MSQGAPKLVSKRRRAVEFTFALIAAIAAIAYLGGTAEAAPPSAPRASITYPIR
jgi:hypothetical protein